MPILTHRALVSGEPADTTSGRPPDRGRVFSHAFFSRPRRAETQMKGRRWLGASVLLAAVVCLGFSAHAGQDKGKDKGKDDKTKVETEKGKDDKTKDDKTKPEPPKGAETGDKLEPKAFMYDKNKKEQ